MINFRFHIVSLTAVFFALAIGLVVGTAALNGPAADSLSDQVRATEDENQQLREQIAQLRKDATTTEQFTEQLAPLVLADRLGARRILVLSTESGQDYVDGVTSMLAIAGASVTGRVRLTDRFFDPARSQELLDVASTALPPSVTTSGLPTTAHAVASSSALLAAVLLVRTPALTADDRRSVLTAYERLGYLTGTGEVAAPADAVVVVTGARTGGPDAEVRTASLVVTLVEFDRAGAVVVATGAAGTPDTVVAAIRASQDLAASISTVDNATTPQGRLVTAWAVADTISGTVGHYGTGTGATLLPKTAP